MSDQNNPQTSSLVAELNRLGENLGKVVRSAWESEERRSIEKELAAGLEQFVKRLNEAVESAQTDPALNKAKTKAKEAWETARGPQIVSEVKTGVVDTLKKINEDLARRAEPAPAHEVKNEPPADEDASKA
ncbi:MAG TPA: hypothetical protein PLG23_03040 [Thermoflexales bacterium]|mgnify:CR=1 FL=1|nr:hypothetical protein [Anaerolineae bacterium]HQV27253.1 hypothetical protein [Thermoflexales bacterium]HQX09224.1 hypothetical protein [Thermoflexales bacterium]HQY23977.1 hypothetical protein [Thermoflexales bacterium]HQZ52407.1 hypothetical protein [Thermoflexales bacterium]